MSAVFADTVYFVALLNEDDQYHDSAVKWAAELDRPLLTTEFILVETATFLSKPKDRGAFVDLVSQLREDNDSTVLACSAALFEAGLSLFAQRPDKSWSLTDCISFAVMQAAAIRDALTADRHFEQAGFNVLLKLDDE